MKKPLIILTGPTASGKTALSVSLAKAIGGEIISADSMQVYKGMDIGSAKVTKEEMDGVPHYLIDILTPQEEFNVVTFVEKAKEAMETIYARGHVPIVAGGTGFYIQALLYDIDFTDNDEDKTFRNRMQELYESEGAEKLHERLKEVDPESAEAIHPNNVKRVIRALEFYEKTGKKISMHNETERQKESPYDFAYYVLNMDRAKLYERTDRRVDIMMQNGLLEEVTRLRNEGCHQGMISMQGIGYKEILDHLDGRMSLDEAVDTLKKDTRHFAKRQITWFKREKNVTWLSWEDVSFDPEKMKEKILSDLKERQIWPRN